MSYQPRKGCVPDPDCKSECPPEEGPEYGNFLHAFLEPQLVHAKLNVLDIKYAFPWEPKTHKFSYNTITSVKDTIKQVVG